MFEALGTVDRELCAPFASVHGYEPDYAPDYSLPDVNTTLKSFPNESQGFGRHPPLAGLFSHQTATSNVSQEVLLKVNQKFVAGGRSRQRTDSVSTAPSKRLPVLNVPLRPVTV